MKRMYLAILIILTLILTLPLNSMAMEAVSGPPELISESAVLMDAETGQVLYEKDMNKRQYPASITKIMTVYLSVEKAKGQDKITMSHDAVFSVPRDASHVALTTDEIITVEQAQYAAMLASANDACNGIAEHISGSMDNFALLMTEKAKEFGALDTNFTNANGLHDENHYTTAYDMAMITKGAIASQEFREIFGTVSYTMSPTNKQTELRYFYHHHDMLKDTKVKYEGVKGGKTGWTSDSKHTLVTLAKRGDRELIVVVMRSNNPDDKYTDTAALLDYGFNEFNELTISQAKIEEDSIPLIRSIENAGVIDVTAEQGISFLLHKDINESMINVSYDIPEGSNENITATAMFALSENTNLMYGKLGAVKLDALVQTAAVPEKKPNNILKIILIVAGIIIVLFFLFYIYVCYMDAKRKRQRRQRMNAVRIRRTR